MVKLIDMLQPAVVKDVQPPEGDLLKLKDYRHRATQLGTLNLVSAVPARHSRRALRALRAHLSSILYEAVKAADGSPSIPIRSTRGTLTPFPVLARWSSTTASAARAPPNRSSRATSTGSTGTPRTSHRPALPAGAAREWDPSAAARVRSLLPAEPDGAVRPDRARELYRKYAGEQLARPGPAGRLRGVAVRDSGPADVDSGPIIMDIGLVATGFGLGAVQAAGDEVRLKKLAAQLALLRPMVAAAAGGAAQQFPSATGWFQANSLTVRNEYVTVCSTATPRCSFPPRG